MKAAQINSYGDSSVIQINKEVPKPSLKEGQVLVEVHASSINPIDVSIRNGFLQQMTPLSFPATIGGDFSGVVTHVGEGVTEFKTGDQVFGQGSVLNGGSGAYAEFVAANTTKTALKPDSLDFTKAGALPLVGASAVQAVEEHINIKQGQRILIHGGAGGIGSLAIQLAKIHGAYVITTASRESEEYVRSLGADEVIDYKTQHFEDIVKDIDAVFDTAGGKITNKSITVLKKGGILVTMAGQPDQELAKQYDARALAQMTSTNTTHLNRLAELVDTGKLKVQTDKIFPIDQIQKAFDYFEKDHPKGKVVVVIKE